MTYKNDIGEILKLEDLCNIGNVSVEPYVRAREMQALTTTGAGGGVDSMTCSPQSVRDVLPYPCLLYTSPSPRDVEESRMPSSA